MVYLVIVCFILYIPSENVWNPKAWWPLSWTMCHTGKLMEFPVHDRMKVSSAYSLVQIVNWILTKSCVESVLNWRLTSFCSNTSKDVAPGLDLWCCDRTTWWPESQNGITKRPCFDTENCGFSDIVKISRQVTGDKSNHLTKMCSLMN